MSTKSNKLYEVFLTQDFRVLIGELDTSDARIRKYIPSLLDECFVNDEVRDPKTEEMLGACIGIWVYGENEEQAAQKAKLYIMLNIYRVHVASELIRVEQHDGNSPSFSYKRLLRELEYT